VDRVVRSPFHRSGFSIGNLEAFSAANPGIIRVLTASDVPGRNLFGVIPPYADQPVFAVSETRFKGEAVAAIVGEREAVAAIELAAFPITWQELQPVLTPQQALAHGAHQIHANRPGNILITGRVSRGDAEAALAASDVMVEGHFETGFVEHAYIEPEAGWARRVGDRIEITASTQALFDRDDTAIMGLDPRPSVTLRRGGGFGSSLFSSFVVLGRMAHPHFLRDGLHASESMQFTTKRHPAACIAHGGDARRRPCRHGPQGDFNTGAYSSLGPTVANRVPVHASGPYVASLPRPQPCRAHELRPRCLPGFGVHRRWLLGTDAGHAKDRHGCAQFRIRNALTASRRQ
jgi:CO/xanthine dehydrogenase Mo-binding subunit